MFCLRSAKHKEAQAAPKLPASVESVAVKADLCLIAQGARTKLSRKLSHLRHAAHGAPQEHEARAQWATNDEFLAPQC